MAEMTKDELNRLIAERLFGHRLIEVFAGAWMCQKVKEWDEHNAPHMLEDIPDYAGTYEGMGFVVEEMCKQGFGVEVGRWGEDYAKVHIWSRHGEECFPHEMRSMEWFGGGNKAPGTLANLAVRALEESKAALFATPVERGKGNDTP